MSDNPTETTTAVKNPNWEREILEKLAFSQLKEQRRARYWGIFFKLLTFAYLFLLLALVFKPDWKPGADEDSDKDGKHTALVELTGMIASDSDANADAIIKALRSAFENEDSVGVIMRINSPGGSPVQSGYIYDEMQRLRKQYPDKPLHAVITDLCASGGYYVAAAAQNIYADKASLVGSIGVIMNGFGFVETLQKLGIERRLVTAGEHKGFLDPFSPQNPAEISHIKGVLQQIHQQFITAVKTGRQTRLKDDPSLFSGLVWSGEAAMKLGLIDDLASSSSVAEHVMGAKKIVTYTAKKDYMGLLMKRLGVSVADTLLERSSGGLLLR